MPLPSWILRSDICSGPTAVSRAIKNFWEVNWENSSSHYNQEVTSGWSSSRCTDRDGTGRANDFWKIEMVPNILWLAYDLVGASLKSWRWREGWMPYLSFYLPSMIQCKSRCCVLWFGLLEFRKDLKPKNKPFPHGTYLLSANLCTYRSNRGSTKKPLSHHLEDFRAIEKILFSTAFTPLIFHAISHLIRDELFFLESLSTVRAAFLNLSNIIEGGLPTRIPESHHKASCYF